VTRVAKKGREGRGDKGCEEGEGGEGRQGFGGWRLGWGVDSMQQTGLQVCVASAAPSKAWMLAAIHDPGIAVCGPLYARYTHVRAGPFAAVVASLVLPVRGRRDSVRRVS
jgi:hypothetical protein